MGLWEDLTDFSDVDGSAVCPLCQKDAKKTVVGDHYKCEEQGHVFNKDGSPLPEDIACMCEICNPEPSKPAGLEDQGKSSEGVWKENVEQGENLD